VRASSRNLVALTIATVLLTPTAVRADHGKIDLVVLVNGDRITCEIRSLRRGRLTVSTDSMSTVTIDWVDVRRVASPVPFEVEISSGRRMLGPLAEIAPGSVRVKTAGEDVDVELSSVVRITPMEAGFWQRLDGSISVGFSFTQADELTQWSLNADASRRTEKFLVTGAYDSMLSTTGNDEGQTRNAVTLTIQRFISRRWFAALMTQATQNEELGLNLRTVVAATLGRYIVMSNRTELGAMAGAAYTRENFVDQPGENRAEAVQGLRWDWFTFAARDIDISHSILVFEGFEPDLRVRLELSSRMRVKIVKDLHWTLNLFESSDSSPPEGEKKNDLGVSASLGWSF
jgi:hypothetical protein